MQVFLRDIKMLRVAYDSKRYAVEGIIMHCLIIVSSPLSTFILLLREDAVLCRLNVGLRFLDPADAAEREGGDMPKREKEGRKAFEVTDDQA